jgi:hypothetical protein
VTSQGTDDTQVVSDLNVQGMAMYDGTRCFLELTHRVKGRAILCGHPRASCPQRKHREESKGKELMEESLKPRSQPVVQIDTTPWGPRAQQLQAWAQPLPMTPQPTIVSLSHTATPNAPTTPVNVPVTPQVTTVSSPQAPAGKPTIPPVSAASVAAPPPLATAPPPASSPAPVVAPQFVLKTVPVAVATAGSTGQPGTARAQVPVQPKVASHLLGYIHYLSQPIHLLVLLLGGAMLVAMLSRLVDKVDALNLSQQTVLTSNGLMMQKLAVQTIELENNRAKLDRAKNVETSQPTPPVASVSVLSTMEGTPNKFYVVAKGRQVGVFT